VLRSSLPIRDHRGEVVVFASRAPNGPQTAKAALSLLFFRVRLDPSEEWLRGANDRYRAADLAPKQRRWGAWKEYAQEHGLALKLGHGLTEITAVVD